MIVVSTDKGNLSFQSVDDVLKFVQTSAQENIELWISGKQPYPCISVCISGEYAAINYFQNDTGDMWLSYNEENQEDVIFMAAGEEWETDILVNATSIGFLDDAKPDIQYKKLPKDLVVCDVIPNKLRTSFLQEAERHNLRTFNGLEMLVNQGALAYELWTGRKAPVEVMKQAMKKEYGEC